MAYERGYSREDRGRPTYARPARDPRSGDRRAMDRGMAPPPRRGPPQRPAYGRGRDPRRGEEQEGSGISRIFEPLMASRISVYAGIAAIAIAILNILVNILPFSWIISCCLSPVYLIGWLAMITAVVFAIIVLVKGDEDQHNSAYLGMGLAVGSIILLVAGGILFSVFGFF